MSIDQIPDDENTTDQPGEPRRSFLRRAAAGLLGGAVAAFGLTRPASASQDPGRPRPGGGSQPQIQVECCNLAYPTYCSPSQINNCHSGWTWTCCAYVGSNLRRVTCGECFAYQCSWAY